ncbi:MAG TPA: PAS domain-containing sensor histidine kinase [Agriterribacter sp.]|nr:PAS domain-containing sensor histidine kinase [Agriterribacter sp.]
MDPTLQHTNGNVLHLNAIFEYATMGILISDEQGIITAINPFALKLFGYTEQELIGRQIEVLIPRRFHTKHVQHRQKYTANPQRRPMGVGLDLYAQRSDGTEFPVEVSLGNYTSGDKKFVIAFISNISVRKETEAEIEKLNDQLEATVELRTKDLTETMQQLQESRDRLARALAFQNTLLDNAGAMIIATDANGIIRLFNPEAADNIGYLPHEVIGNETPVIFHDKADIERKRMELSSRHGIYIENDFEVLIEKARRNIHEEEQYVYVRKNNTSFPVSLTITAIHDSDQQIIGYIGIAIDISERIKTEENLLKSLEKEKELNELKSRFVSLASHEFRTPLSTVLSSAYLVEKYVQTDDQPKRQKHVQRIVSSVNTLTDILNDFLSVGKIEEGKLQVRYSNFNVKQLAMSIVEEMKPVLRKQQDIHYSHSGIEEVLLDASMIKHIVLNLISNASKFSPEKSSIHVNTISDKETLLLLVKDQGIGISEDDQKHLAERFFRASNAGNVQGTGLGLHIVSKYAELMNGTVRCTSKLGSGTEFTVTFIKNNQCNEKDTTD